jgi:hypothetical protein
LEDGVSGPATPVEGVEYRDAVGAAHRRLAVQGERLGAQLGGCDGNPAITICPVIAAAGEEPHSLAIPADDQPITVVLDLVHPAGPGRWLVSEGRNARVDEAVGANTEHVRENSGWPAESGGPSLQDVTVSRSPKPPARSAGQDEPANTPGPSPSGVERARAPARTPATTTHREQLQAILSRWLTTRARPAGRAGGSPIGG